MIHIPDSIFPQDNEGNLLCPKCRQKVEKCSCPSGEAVKRKIPKISPVIRIDKSGRKGKTVTVISALPANEVYLKDMAKVLKARSGSGGTFYIADGVGVIEIQGDHRTLCVDIIHQH